MNRLRIVKSPLVVCVLIVSSSVLLAAAVQGLSVGQTLPDRQPDPSQDPCSGLSDEECDGLVSKSREDFWARLPGWIEDFNTSSVDPRALPKAALNSRSDEPRPDLASAVADTDIVVLGKAMGIRFEGTGDALIAFSVERSAKGPDLAEVSVLQNGGPQPYPDWTSPTLGIDESNPLLLPGDRALLFLYYDESDGQYQIQPWTGHYQVDAEGTLSALEGNPFAASAAGRRAEEFLSTIETIVAQEAR